MSYTSKRIDPWQIVINLIVALVSLICILPFVLVIMTSLTAEGSIVRNGYSFVPEEWSLSAYKMLFNPDSLLPESYRVTITSTLIGTFVATLITYCAGYALSCKQMRYRNGLALYFFITMVFSAGLVPWYMVSKAIGCYNNIWALIVPSLLFSPFNMYLVRNFTRDIPDALGESARMEGAGELLIAFRIYLPLCVPVIATITLFYAIGYWNNYFNAVMLVDGQKLYTLQMYLFKIQSEIRLLGQMQGNVGVTPPRESFKMATCVLTMGPIILLYPLLQRYFIKGMTVGAVKG